MKIVYSAFCYFTSAMSAKGLEIFYIISIHMCVKQRQQAVVSKSRTDGK